MKKVSENLELVAREEADELITLRNLAVDLRESYGATVEKYWALCVHIRDKQITPDVLTAQLQDLGFVDSRISEIKRVSFSTAEIFDDYRAKAIGFKLALEKSRDVKKKKKPAKQADLFAADAFNRDFEAFLLNHVPLAGKLPKFLNTFVKVQGCEIRLSVKRLTKTQAMEVERPSSVVSKE